MSGGFQAAGSFSSKLAAGEQRRAEQEVHAIYFDQPVTVTSVSLAFLFLFFHTNSSPLFLLGASSSDL